MDSRGMSLVELVVVIGIMGILLSIGTLQFNQYSRKAQIDAQVKMMYADLMKARHDALYQKIQLRVRFESGRYGIYTGASATAVANPLMNKSIRFPVVSDGALPLDVTFDTTGFLMAGSPNNAVCIGPGTNPAPVDSIGIFQTQIRMGKYNGFCNYSTGIVYR